MTEISRMQDTEDTQVILGDGTSQKAISLQLAQAFYNEITGKSERISEEFSNSFILKMSDVEQLHHRIIQSTTQYNVETANASFSVKYWNDSSERFSSIERFMAHAGAKGIAVEEVDINYNMLVILPRTNKPQEYCISVRLLSRMAKVESMKKELSQLPVSIPLSQFENKFTCRVSIDFVDVTVAHSFLSVVKNWCECLEETTFNPAIKFLRRFSHLLPLICKYGLLSIGCYFTLKQSKTYFVNPLADTTAMFVLRGCLFHC